MKRWMHKIEVIVDKLIPPALIVLLAVIILDLGFSEFVAAHHLEPYMVAADYAIIALFVVDLVFKWLRTRHIPLFLRKYWLDILAVFPFFLLFRLFEAAAGAFSFAVSESAQTVQAVVHEGLEVEKEGAKLIQEAEKIATQGSRVAKGADKISKLSRSAKFMRFLRPILRLPRFIKAIPRFTHFYEKPTGEHHEHEYKPKFDRKGRVKRKKKEEK
jgi:hypothetical protein